MNGSALLSFLLLAGLAQTASPAPDYFYQAHRGGLREVPENTLAAFRHAWACPGAVPELDIQSTSDGAYVCIHDDTPGRTTNAPPEFKHRKISGIDSNTIRQWDAGIVFAKEFEGEKVPFLQEVFEEMKGRPERSIYLDAKAIDPDALAALIQQYGLNEQVIFTHESPDACAEFKKKLPGARSMTWLSGPATLIRSRFQKLAEEKFKGLDQLQLHLKTTHTKPDIAYALDDAFIRAAAEQARAAGVELQLRPFEFDAKSLRPLLQAGVRWFVTDEPSRFSKVLAEAAAQ